MNANESWTLVQKREAAARTLFRDGLEAELIAAGHDGEVCFLHPETLDYVTASSFLLADRHFRSAYPHVEPVRLRIGHGPAVYLMCDPQLVQTTS